MMTMSIKWFLLLTFLGIFPALSYADTYTFDSSGTSHFFDPAVNDQSLIYLGEIFGTIAPILAGAGSTFLGQLFSIFNTVVLTVAIFFVGYTTFVGVLNTAGEGEMFGRKWSSLWVPFRLVLGIGLLVPSSSGYCVAQMSIIWVVVQGIGAADHLTNSVINYMEEGQTVFIRSMEDATGGDQGANGGATGSSAGPETINAYDTTIKALFQNMVCMQSIYKQKISNGEVVSVVVPPKLVQPPDNNAQYIITFPDPSVMSIPEQPSETCGKITIDQGNADSNDFHTFYDPYLIHAINALMPSINAAAYYMVNYNPYLYDDDPENDSIPFWPSDDQTTEDSILEATYHLVGSNYLNELSETYQSFVDQAQQAIEGDDSKHTDYYENIRAYGWVSLGNIYWYMIKSVSGQLQAEGASLCLTIDPSKTITDAAGIVHTCKPPEQYGHEGIDRYTQTYAPDFIDSLIATRDNAKDAADSGDFVVSSGESIAPVAAMVKAINGAIMKGLSNRYHNPIVSAQKIGHTIIIAVEIFFAVFTFTMLTLGGAFGVMSSIQPYFLVIQAIAALILPGLFLLATVFFILGGTLSVIVPMIPPIIFFLAVTHWMLSVTESMVAGPIVAMGILHPEGSELWGKAEPAVMLMINMFLRPSLIVIGLAAGVMLSFVSTGFINFAFFNAMNLTMGSNDEHGSSTTAIESILFLFMYVGLIIAAINKSFGTIHAVPDMVMRWISGGERSQFGRGGAEDMQKVSEQQGKGESSGKEYAQDSSRSAESAEKRGHQAGKGLKTNAQTSDSTVGEVGDSK